MGEIDAVSAVQLKAALHDGREVAVLDAREEGDYATSHLLMAVSVPYSRLEHLVFDRVPRLGARIIWMDAGEGLAEMAARRCVALGFESVCVLSGGIEAWRMAGYAVYTGVHVPSKAFAEVVEHDEATPWLSADALREKIATDPGITILDSRSYEEYHSNTIPGAVSCPGAELVYRIRDLVPSPDSLVVVNCGGRTRSIIGAQSLRNAGLSNPVVSLRDGTMAWHLAGLEVATGRDARPGPVSPQALAWAREAAASVAARFEIARIDAATLERWASDPERTLYVVDVRTPAEFEQGHIARARSVPGGQLVQETDSHLGVWGARVVLTDDDGVRATMTASWLAQMGWDVSVFVPGPDHPRETGPRPSTVLGMNEDAPTYSPSELATAQEQPVVPLVVDIGSSEAYERAHVRGAWFCTRGGLELGTARLPAAAETVITSPDGSGARLAAAQLARQGKVVRTLVGGTDAWLAAGLPVEHGMSRAATPANDLWHTPRRRDPARREAAMREYLAWETALVYQIKQDDDCRYRRFPH